MLTSGAVMKRLREILFGVACLIYFLWKGVE
jgi:hypothetical protein